MKKIPTVFKRSDDDHLVRDEVVEGCEWVLAGDGVPTIKWDGTACMVKDGRLYRRYDAKEGRPAPIDFLPAQDEPDAVTGHWPGWVPVDGHVPADKYHREAWERLTATALYVEDGTYELLGPKVQGNPYEMTFHKLRRHGDREVAVDDRSFEGLRKAMDENRWEGVVFRHKDGRMAKVKRRDFGLPWPVPFGPKALFE